MYSLRSKAALKKPQLDERIRLLRLEQRHDAAATSAARSARTASLRERRAAPCGHCAFERERCVRPSNDRGADVAFVARNVSTRRAVTRVSSVVNSNAVQRELLRRPIRACAAGTM